jgi:UDP-N-acetylmuramoyl-tripeptide--D-alanyl-D-alanine ligase
MGLTYAAPGVAPEVTGISIDSRTTEPGDLFVAIPGVRVDPHELVSDAISRGAVAVVAERDINAMGIPVLRVPNSLDFLGALAHWYRTTHLTCKVLAITGSSGKTTTKDLLVQICQGAGVTVGARGSFNTEVGVPLTILSADRDTEYLVLEMGMRGLGHIKYLVECAEPTIGIVLNVGQAHLGMLANDREIAQAKSEMVSALSESATAVVNGDDPACRAMIPLAPGHCVVFGETREADVQLQDVAIDDQGRPSFRLVFPDGTRTSTIQLQLVGEHMAMNAAAAAAAAWTVGIEPALIAERLSHAEQLSAMRMAVTRTNDGVIVINDAYNANPQSMRAALRALKAIRTTGRTWAVLGEMLELGPASMELHDEIGRLVVRLDLSRLVCVGEGTRVMHLAASNEGSWGQESIWLPDAATAIEHLRANLAPGDVVLVKASRSIGLEQVAEALLEAKE